MCPKICVLGDDLKSAIYLLDLLCRENPESIIKRRPDFAVMNDGTQLFAMSISDSVRFKGREFDYIFCRDGGLGYYCWRYGDTMEYITQRCLAHSEAPPEFQWSKISTSIN